VRRAFQAGSSAVLMLAIMFMGSLVLWVGLPLACLYLGSKVQDASDSVGLAIIAMAFALVAGIFAIVPLLGYLNRKHMEVRAARGLDTYGQAPLEGVLVVSAVVALAGFVVWFFFFAGTAPIPVPGSDGQ
jgi:hypothetical protein